MKIFDRMGLLIRADAHGMMDRLEERTLLVKQHLREAEIELGRKRARLSAIDEELVRLDEEGRRAEARVSDLDADVELALGRGEEDLARFAVRRLLPERTALRAMRDRCIELEAERERLASRLAEQESAFESLRVRARAKLSEFEDADEAGAIGFAAVADEEIELELLRRRGAGRTGADDPEREVAR
jgi:phage shock protein A